MAAHLTSEQLDRFQDQNPSFFCPITKELMTNPVITSDGHTYDQFSIEEWLKSNNTSPVTNTVLENKSLVQNHALRNAIEKSLENFERQPALPFAAPTQASPVASSLGSASSSEISSAREAFRNLRNSITSQLFSSPPAPQASPITSSLNSTSSSETSSVRETLRNLHSNITSQFFSSPQASPMASAPASDYTDHPFKLLLVGNSSVGASSLILRFAVNMYTDTPIVSLGVDYYTKTISLGESKVRLNIFDKIDSSQTRHLYLGANAIIVAFDVTDSNSLLDTAKFLKDIHSSPNPTAIVTLAATKSDAAPEKWKISKADIYHFAERNSKKVFFTSARLGDDSVNALFNNTAISVLQEKLGPQNSCRK